MLPFVGALMLVVIGAVVLVTFMSGFVRYIPNNRVGIVEKA